MHGFASASDVRGPRRYRAEVAQIAHAHALPRASSGRGRARAERTAGQLDWKRRGAHERSAPQGRAVRLGAHWLSCSLSPANVGFRTLRRTAAQDTGLISVDDFRLDLCIVSDRSGIYD